MRVLCVFACRALAPSRYRRGVDDTVPRADDEVVLILRLFPCHGNTTTDEATGKSAADGSTSSTRKSTCVSSSPIMYYY